jgi:N-acyl homoserine lactone hydrolase
MLTRNEKDGATSRIPAAGPGRAPGSVSLLVGGCGHPSLLMVGDLTYDAHLLHDGHVPGVGERRGLDDTTKAINVLREQNPDPVILPTHDPGAAARPAPVTSALAER